MKLRVRPSESKDTLGIEVPNPCSIHQLKQIITSQIFSSPSSILLWLNRETELKSSSPHDSLQSIGITSGDLIFYSIVSNSSSSQILTSNSQVSDQESNRDFQFVGFDSRNSNYTVPILEVGESSSSKGMKIDDGSTGLVGIRFSETCFLKKMLKEALGDNDKNPKRLLIASVHAVLLESGFVALDSVSGMPIDGFNLADLGSTVSVCYTLPEILGNSSVIEKVVVKFQIMRGFVHVFGALANDGSESYHLCLAERNVVLTIGLFCAYGMAERQVYEFWKIVKDGIAFPLLIDLRDKARLPSPSCLMSLPPDLKMRILKLLRGVDVARVGCVCEEMMKLSCDEELWQQKFAEEFPLASVREEMTQWKKRYPWHKETKRLYARHWPTRKIYAMRRETISLSYVPTPFRFILRRGGDYDLSPLAQVPSPFLRPCHFPRSPLAQVPSPFLRPETLPNGEKHKKKKKKKRRRRRRRKHGK